MAEVDYVWFGMKVTPEQKRKIKRLAALRGTSQKAAVLDAVEHELGAEDQSEEDLPEAQPGSFLEGIEDLVGSVEGPPDLSTNPKYMEGFGES